jgi:type I restriction enzyme S subunit
MSWENRNFRELGFLGRGKSRHRPRNDESLYGGKYPMIQTGDVKAANFYITSFSQTYNEKGLSQSKLWEPDTLCITIAANIAETAILGMHACFPDSIIGFIADEEKSDVRFIKYFFDIYKERMQRISQGATQDNLSLEKLLTFEVPTPPLQTQKRIADILSAYDDLIENNLKRIKLLEQAAQNIYKEWFTHLRFPGHENVDINEKSGLPVGWKEEMLKDSCYLIMGQSPKSEYYNSNNEGLPFHQGVTGYGNRFVTHSTYCTKETRLAEEGDILCSVRAPVGRLNISPSKLIIGRGLSAVRNKNGSQSFQYYQLKSHFHKEDMIGGGAIFNSVTKKVLEEQKLLSPSNDIILDFESIVNSVDKQISVLDIQNQKLKVARDILLPRLMNRTIEV